MSITVTPAVAACPDEPDGSTRYTSELALRFQLMDARTAVADLLKAADAMMPHFPDLAFDIGQAGFGIKVEIDDRLSGRRPLRGTRTPADERR